MTIFLIVYMGDDIKRQITSVGVVLIQLSTSQILPRSQVLCMCKHWRRTYSMLVKPPTKDITTWNSMVIIMSSNHWIKMVNNLFSIANKKAIDIHLVLVWQVHPKNLMLLQVFPPLPKHQHCKLSCGIINWGIYI